MSALYPLFNEAVNRIASALPEIAPVADEALVDSFEKISGLYNATGKIYVWNGACDNTIYDSAKVNLQFRAWHDYNHITLHKDFEAANEHSVMLAQQMQLRDKLAAAGYTQRGIAVCLALLECEVDGQGKYLNDHGKYVEDQIGFTQKFMAAKGYNL